MFVTAMVIEEGADKAEIENKIKTMKNYFAEYETQVTFITEEELNASMGLTPCGLVIHSGVTGVDEENISVVEYFSIWEAMQNLLPVCL